VVGVQRDADGGVEVEGHPLQADRLGERHPEPGGHLAGRGGVPDRRQQHRELVTAQPGHHVARPYAVDQAVRDDLQQPVADRVAEGVVDLLEPVEVEQEQAHPLLSARLRERLLGAQHQQLPVGQAGETVVHGLVVAAQGQGGGEVDGHQGGHEEGHQSGRVRHDDDDQRGEPDQPGVDQTLVPDRGPDHPKHRAALVQRHRPAHQHRAHHEVGGARQADRRQVGSGGHPRLDRARPDPEQPEHHGARRARQGDLGDVEHHPVPGLLGHHAVHHHGHRLQQDRDGQPVVEQHREGEHGRGVGAADDGRGGDDHRAQFAQHDQYGEHPEQRHRGEARQLDSVEEQQGRDQRREADHYDAREEGPQRGAHAGSGVACIGQVGHE
jgi:hypothetical protein